MFRPRKPRLWVQFPWIPGRGQDVIHWSNTNNLWYIWDCWYKIQIIDGDQKKRNKERKKDVRMKRRKVPKYVFSEYGQNALSPTSALSSNLAHFNIFFEKMKKLWNFYLFIHNVHCTNKVRNVFLQFTWKVHSLLIDMWGSKCNKWYVLHIAC